MVDFNNETIVGIPAQDIERVLILQARNDFLIAREYYEREKLQANNTDITLMKIRLQTLFLQIQSLLKRRLGKDYNPMFTEVFNNSNYETIIKNYLIINELLDTINLTRIDTKRIYDRLRVEEENKEKI